MKKIIKVLALTLSLALSVFAFSACGTKDKTDSDKSGEKLKIGVIQYMSHPSLDNCYNGIKQALEALSYHYFVINQ